MSHDWESGRITRTIRAGFTGLCDSTASSSAGDRELLKADTPMGLMNWLRGLAYSGYDRHGKLKYLSGRSNDPGIWSSRSRPIRPEQFDDALHLLCDAFDIPDDQKYCLRPEDDLMAIYHSMVGPRSWDDMEFERLWQNLEQALERNLSQQEFESLKTVGDVVHLAAHHRTLSGSYA